MRGRKRAHGGQINAVGEGLSDYLFDHLVVEIVLKHMVDLENPGITAQGTGGAELIMRSGSSSARAKYSVRAKVAR